MAKRVPKKQAKSIDLTWWITGPNDQKALDEGCFIDPSEGEFICDFIEKFIRYSGGDEVGQPVKLLEWERSFIMRLFSWRRPKPDGRSVRRYSSASVWISKKNGVLPR